MFKNTDRGFDVEAFLYQKEDEEEQEAIFEEVNDEIIFEKEVQKERYTAEDVNKFKQIAKRIAIYDGIKKKLSRYEYFMLGGISFDEAASLIYYMNLNNEFRKVEYSILKRFIHTQMSIDSTKKVNFILQTHYQFGDYVVSDAEKIEIWNDLLNNSGIDPKNIDDLVFSGAVRNYAFEKGLIGGKKDDIKRFVKSK